MKTAETLAQDVPDDEIEQREGPGGRMLSYVSGFYVVDMLNQIFGHDGWAHEIRNLKEVVALREITTNSGVRFVVAYTCECILRVRHEKPNEHDTTHEDVGYGDGMDKDAGKAVESAVKEAATDALKRAARHYGRRLGLSLYADKKRPAAAHQQPPPRQEPQRTSWVENDDGRDEPPPGGQIATDDSADPADFEIPFGKNRGKRMGSLSDNSLSWYAEECTKPDIRAMARAVLRDRQHK
jgi:DNA recombination protein Rad52